MSSALLKSSAPTVFLGPTQPSCQSLPLAASIVTERWKLSVSRGTVPLMNSSSTVFVVNGPGRMPVNASTLATSRPEGLCQPSIGRSLLTSRMMRDQSGADESSDNVSVFGSLLLFPIQTPTARAGSDGSFGGARKPYACVSRLSFVVPVL